MQRRNNIWSPKKIFKKIHTWVNPSFSLKVGNFIPLWILFLLNFDRIGFGKNNKHKYIHEIVAGTILVTSMVDILFINPYEKRITTNEFRLSIKCASIITTVIRVVLMY